MKSFIPITCLILFGGFGQAEAQQPPEEGLQAPFINNDFEIKSDLYNLYNESLGSDILDTRVLTNPHRSQYQIADWLMEAVPISMTFGRDDLLNFSQTLSPYFTSNGREDLRRFLGQSQEILAAIRDDQLRVSTFVSDVPRLLREGPSGDAYRWAFEVPVKISFVPKDQKAADRSNNTIDQLIRLQIVHVEEAPPHEEGLAIERWVVE